MKEKRIRLLSPNQKDKKKEKRIRLLNSKKNITAKAEQGGKRLEGLGHPRAPMSCLCVLLSWLCCGLPTAAAAAACPSQSYYIQLPLPEVHGTTTRDGPHWAPTAMFMGAPCHGDRAVALNMEQPCAALWEPFADHSDCSALRHDASDPADLVQMQLATASFSSGPWLMQTIWWQGIVIAGLFGELFHGCVVALVLSFRIYLKHHSPKVVLGIHPKTRKVPAVPWFQLRKRYGPWRAAFRQFDSTTFPLVAARMCGRTRVVGVRGLVGFAKCWRLAPCRRSSIKHRHVLKACVQYLHARSRFPIRKFSKPCHDMSTPCVFRNDLDPSLDGFDNFGSLRGGKGGKKQNWGQTHGSGNDSKGDLASALLGFLSQWQQEKSCNKSRSNDGLLARELISALKTDLNHGKSDRDIVSTIEHVLQNRQGPNQDAWEQRSPSRHTAYRQDPPGSRKVTWSGAEEPSTKRQKVQNPPAQRAKNSRFTDHEVSVEPPKKKGKGCGYGVDDVPSLPHWNFHLKGPRFAFHINQLEWSDGASLCNLNDINKAISNGDNLPGNLIVTRDPNAVRELRTIWDAHKCDHPLTVAEVQPKDAGSSGPLTSVWWKPGKHKGVRPLLQNLKLTQISSKPGPTLKTGKKTTIPHKVSPSLVTLRLITPQFYRECFQVDAARETPMEIIRFWAQKISCRVSLLTGGHWQLIQHKHGCFRIAHLRISRELAEKAVEQSGHDGYFASILATKDTPLAPVVWVPRQPGMDCETYFKLASSLAQKQGKPLAIRQGGYNDLGIINGSREELPKSGPKVWCLRNAPRHWQEQHVREFLEAELWQNIEIKARRRSWTKGNPPDWVFRSSAPPGSNNDLSFFQYNDDDTHLTISPDDVFRKRKPHNSEWLRGPKKVWTDHDFPPLQSAIMPEEIPTTQLDPPTQSQAEASRDRSPRRQKQEPKGKILEPDNLLTQELNQGLAGPDLWHLEEAGGNGDCGYRAAARCIAQYQQKILSAEGTKREAANLRVLAISKMRNHPKFKDKWAPDDQEKVLSELGMQGPSQSFEEYIEWASKQEYWIDGLQLKSLAEKLDRNIVVFKWRRSEHIWQRYFISGKPLEKSPPCKYDPLVLALKDGHYRSVLKPKHDTEVPATWMSITEEQTRSSLQGAGPKSIKEPRSHQSRKPVSAELDQDVRSAVSDKLSLPSPSSVGLSLPACSKQPSVALSLGASSKMDLNLDPATAHAGSPVAKSAARSSNPAQDFADNHSRDLEIHASRADDGGETCQSTFPFVKLPPKVSVWWTCSCGFQILRHEDLNCHGTRRRKHLNVVHNIAYSDMPPNPPGAVADSANRRKVEFSRRCQVWLDLAQNFGWADMHQLIPCRKGWRIWQCKTCGHSFTHWNKAVLSCCDAGSASASSKRPTESKRLQLANKWWEQAKEQCATEASACLDLLNKFSFLNNQERLNKSKSLSSPPKLFGGLPLVPANPSGPQIWWSCSLCSFKICGSPKNKSWVRKRHLQTMHNIEKVPRLSAQGLAAAKSIQASQSAVKERWLRRVALFRRKAWAGSHDIEEEPCCVTLSRCKSGKTLQFPRYKCKRCDRSITSGDVPVSICCLHPQRAKAPSLTRRKQIWHKCLQDARTSTPKGAVKVRSKFQSKPKANSGLSLRTAGTSQIGRGLRGIRVGEASHPGPQQSLRHGLRVWSVNISSWRSHGASLLEAAKEKGAQVLILQETNMSEVSTPGFSHSVQRAGWQLLHVAPPDRHKKGGVAVLTKDPCALIQVHSYQSGSGQLLVAELQGLQRPLLIGSLYRHASDVDFAILQQVAMVLESHGGRDWIFGMDANASMHHGPIPDFFSRYYGHCAAEARHTREPIDGIWCCPGLHAVSQAEHASPSDHTIAEALFDIQVRGRNQQHWRFTHTRRLIADLAENTSNLSEVDWGDVACSTADWQQALKDVDSAWSVWTQDAEHWLLARGVVTSAVPERMLGTQPVVTSGSHRVASMQSCQERQLRRYLRRLDEALFHSRRGSSLPQNLKRNILRFPKPREEHVAVSAGLWGQARNLAQCRLQAMIQSQHAAAVAKWKKQVHTIPGACKWLRQEFATPFVVKDQDNHVVASKPEAVEALKSYWSSIFGTAQNAVDIHSFCNFYQHVFPTAPDVASLPKITCADLRRALQRMRGKAGGPDNWTPDLLLELPQQSLIRLSEFLLLCERRGAWPAALTHWAIKFIPKKKGVGPPSLDEVRPVAVGPVVYRVWSAVRLRDLSSHLSGLFDRHQVKDVYDCLVSLNLEYPPEDFPFGACLDFAKCFDSVDSALCVELLRRVSVPPRVCNLLACQWQQHQRWICFGNCVSSHPLVGALGLPQGDPWSPCALTLCLLLPLRHQHSACPQTRTFLYLDDRTVIARSLADLRHALSCWDSFCQLTRVRTHDGKTQTWARSYDSFIQFQSSNFAPAPQMSVDILGVSVNQFGRLAGAAEDKRALKCQRLARRAALLPCSHAFKSALSALVLSPVVSWGGLLGGHVPTVAAASAFLGQCRLAVKGFSGGHESVHLQQVLLLGHTSDLLFQCVQRALKALHKWRASRAPAPLRPNNCFLQCLSKAVSRLGGSVPSLGVFRFGGFIWDTASPSGFVPGYAHCLRQFWRRGLVRRWLSSKRNDAIIARASNLSVSESLVDRLRAVAQSVNGHGRQVMAGGLSTEAHASPVPSFCSCCCQSVVPSTDHILWCCPKFHSIRRYPRPADELEARLGWGVNGPKQHLIQQMGQIRAACIEEYIRLGVRRAGGGGGAGGPRS